MDTRELIFVYAGGAAAFLFCIAICYWSVNFFIRQSTQRSCEVFREHMAREAERALAFFREGICEQIVEQESRSDALAKLYASLIDLMRVGKEFTAAAASGDVQLAERMLRSIRSTGDTFSELFQKGSLHFTDELCNTLKAFIAQQKSVQQQMENDWNSIQKGGGEGGGRLPEIRQNWLQFEDRIGRAMDAMRSEFRNRQPAGNVMMKWLNDPPA